MTPEELLKAMPYARSRAQAFAQPLTAAMAEFGIDTSQRKAAFIAQIAHESGSLKYVREIADGSAYEGRADLGNSSPGDGAKFKGRGLIQVTGRRNFSDCAKALGLPLLERPELLETPENASRSAAWFWKTRKLNQLADEDRFGAITKIINGGYNGLDDRIKHWLRARKVFGL